MESTPRRSLDYMRVSKALSASTHWPEMDRIQPDSGVHLQLSLKMHCWCTQSVRQPLAGQAKVGTRRVFSQAAHRPGLSGLNGSEWGGDWMVNWWESGWVPWEDMGDPISVPEHAETQTCHYNPPRGDRVGHWDIEIWLRKPAQHTEWQQSTVKISVLGYWL